jgi:hypothetical protein
MSRRPSQPSPHPATEWPRENTNTAKLKDSFPFRAYIEETYGTDMATLHARQSADRVAPQLPS